jgi:hypothetical protein
MKTLKERFDLFEDEFLKHEKGFRVDLAAFVLLNELQPGTSDIVGGAEHDGIYLKIDVKNLNEVITDDQVKRLAQYGVTYDETYDCLSMFV